MALDIENDAFLLSLSQPITEIPGFSPLTVQVSIGVDEKMEHPQISFPQLHGLISLTGNLVAIELRIAQIMANHIALLAPFNPRFNLALDAMPQSLLL